jgi:hypothetical protein
MMVSSLNKSVICFDAVENEDDDENFVKEEERDDNDDGDEANE